MLRTLFDGVCGWFRTNPPDSSKEVPSPPKRPVQRKAGMYNLCFNGDREPHRFRAENDLDALKEMCRKLGMTYPPLIATFRSRGGLALYRLEPLEQIFPPETLRTVHAGVVQLHDVRKQQMQMPPPRRRA